jgi:uncharacterized membrane protein
MQIPSHIQEHIDTIARHEQEFYAKRSRADKIGNAVAGFAGNFAFVLIHLAIFAVWMTANTASVGLIPQQPLRHELLLWEWRYLCWKAISFYQ